MAEYPSPEQGNPTPQQLNAALNSVLDRLPKERLSGMTGGFDVDEKAGLFQLGRALKRQDSEYGKRLAERTAELVSRAGITERFKEFIIERFAVWSEEGIDPDNDIEDFNKQFFFLDRKHLGSGGIFDPTRAVTLERVALAQKVSQLSFAEKAWTRIV